MENLKKKAALQLLGRGYSVMPIRPISKLPAYPKWSELWKRLITEEELDQYFTDKTDIGMLTGGAPRVLCVDIDTKYDLSGDLFERFIEEIPLDIRSQMMCESTRNKGYHLVVKVPPSCLKGNERWAARPTTTDEKHQTYLENFKDFSKRDVALQVAVSDTLRVLIETRSGTPEQCGGYFLITPSDGYQYLWGKIGELTEDQYEQLECIARSFNLSKELKPVVVKNVGRLQNWETTPFEHFNEEGDVLELFSEYGWTVVHTAGKNIRLLRPGKTYSADSGIYDSESGIFNCFSTSTAFNVGCSYDKAGIFATLVCGGNSSEAYHKLISLGYGKTK